MITLQNFFKVIAFLLTGFFLVSCSSPQIYAPVFNNHNPHKNNTSSRHIVREGDTLYSIAWQNNRDYKELAKWNGIAHPYTIHKGQKISLLVKRTRKKASNKKAPSKKILVAKRRPQKNEINKKREVKQASSKETSKHSKKNLKLSWRWPIKVMKLENGPVKSGVVLVGSVGELIRSSEKGKVVYAGNGLKGYGNLLIIMHSNEFLTAYGYNKRLLVKEGSVVGKGQAIAEIGRDNQKRQVLFFEMRQHGKAVPVKKYLPILRG